MCITGRLNELIITAGGENVVSVLSHCVIISDVRKNVVTVLVTLKTTTEMSMRLAI